MFSLCSGDAIFTWPVLLSFINWWHAHMICYGHPTTWDSIETNNLIVLSPPLYSQKALVTFVTYFFFFFIWRKHYLHLLGAFKFHLLQTCLYNLLRGPYEMRVILIVLHRTRSGCRIKVWSLHQKNVGSVTSVFDPSIPKSKETFDVQGGPLPLKLSYV